ncbi:MAG: hypothetical protein PWR20_1778 [Bacteroidales bacterium]|jgi:hypothetical protein|nr:hypothetical protein [Bacteroidales bacterium]MDN5329077.1 hypothetical protein [Bacteroidales bacterium]
MSLGLLLPGAGFSIFKTDLRRLGIWQRKKQRESPLKRKVESGTGKKYLKMKTWINGAFLYVCKRFLTIIQILYVCEDRNPA